MAVDKATFIICSKAVWRSADVVSACVTKESDTVKRHAALLPNTLALWNKANDLYRLITALGIRHVGVKAAKILAKQYKRVVVVTNYIEKLKKIEKLLENNNIDCEEENIPFSVSVVALAVAGSNIPRSLKSSKASASSTSAQR